MTRSLRNALLIRTTAVLIVTFLVSAVALYLLMRAALLAEFDAALLLEARLLAAHVQQSGAQVTLDLDAAALSQYAAPHQPHFYQIWSNEGDSVKRSPSLIGRDLTPADSDSTGPHQAFVELPNGRAGRQVTLAFHPRFDDAPSEGEGGEQEQPLEATDRPPLRIAVGRPITELLWTLSKLQWLLLSVTAAAIAVSVALQSGVIQQGLQSLHALALSIERVGVADLAERLPTASCPREVAPVVERLNELLARLEQAMNREKAFTADIAHELRTPLAGLETALEVCATRRRDPETYQEVIGKCLRVTQGMHLMVNNLLILARAEANQLAASAAPVMLRELLAESWSPFEERAMQRDLQVQWLVEEDAVAVLDREQVKVILTNLFDNAVTYANEGGWIKISAALVERSLTIVVSNSGCDLSDADLNHVFERFWRGDQARSATGVHCGLGLPLCRKIATALQGEITAQASDGVFSACFRFSRQQQLLIPEKRMPAP